jgi:chromosome partitioning protein
MRDDLAEGEIPVFKTMIRRTVGFAKAAMAGRPIRDLEDSRARAAWEDYKALGEEIREMLK